MPGFHEIIASLGFGHAYNEHRTEYSNSNYGQQYAVDSRQGLANFIQETLNDPSTRAVYGTGNERVVIYNAERNVIMLLNSSADNRDSGTVFRVENPDLRVTGNISNKPMTKFDSKVEGYVDSVLAGDKITSRNTADVKAMVERFSQNHLFPNSALREMETTKITNSVTALQAEANAPTQQEIDGFDRHIQATLNAEARPGIIKDDMRQAVRQGAQTTVEGNVTTITPQNPGDPTYRWTQFTSGKSEIEVITQAGTEAVRLSKALNRGLEPDLRDQRMRGVIDRVQAASNAEGVEIAADKATILIEPTDPEANRYEITKNGDGSLTVSAMDEAGKVTDTEQLPRSYSSDLNTHFKTEALTTRFQGLKNFTASLLVAGAVLVGSSNPAQGQTIETPKPIIEQTHNVGERPIYDGFTITRRSYDFSAPEFEPSVANPNGQVVTDAREALLMAENLNETHRAGLTIENGSSLVSGIDDAQAKFLLESYVAGNRVHTDFLTKPQTSLTVDPLLSLGLNTQSSNPFGLPNNNLTLDRVLGIETNLSDPVNFQGLRIDDRPILLNGIDSFQQPTGTNFKSPISVIQMPVEGSGNSVETKTYIVDPNFRAMAMTGSTNSPEHRLMQTEVGQAIARRMSVDGYVEATPAVMQELSRSGFFESGGRLNPQTMLGERTTSGLGAVDSDGLTVIRPNSLDPSRPLNIPESDRVRVTVDPDGAITTRPRSPLWNDPASLRGAGNISAGTSVGMSSFALYSKLTNDVFRQHFDNSGAARNWAITSVGMDATALTFDAAHFGTMRYGNRIIDSIDDAARAAKMAGSLGRVARVAGPVGLVLSVGAGVAEYKAAENANMGYEAARAIGATAGGLTGGIGGGAATGAIAGIWLGPIGSAVCAAGGAIIFGVAGAFAGGELSAEALGEKLQEEFDQETQGEINKMVSNTGQLLEGDVFKNLKDSLVKTENSTLADRAMNFQQTIATHADIRGSENSNAVNVSRDALEEEISATRQLPTLTSDERHDLELLETAVRGLYAMEAMRTVPESDPAAETRRQENVERLAETLNEITFMKEVSRVNSSLISAANSLDTEMERDLNTLSTQTSARYSDEQILGIANENLSLFPVILSSDSQGLNTNTGLGRDFYNAHNNITPVILELHEVQSEETNDLPAHNR